MKTQILVCGLLVAFQLAAQTPPLSVPVPLNRIDIQAARTAFSAVPVGDRTIACDSPTLVQHKEALTYCTLVRNLLDPTASTVSFAIFAMKDQSLLSAFISGVADSNLGTHLGSSVSSPGTTNAVERTGYSDVLGLALESGAITNNVSGSTLDLQANALSLSRFLTNQDVFQYYCPDGKLSCQGVSAEILNRVSGSAALSVSNVTTQSVTGTVTGSSGNSSGNSSSNSTPPSATALIQNGPTRLTSVTIHGQIWSSLDLRSKSYIDAWKTAVGSSTVTGLAKTAEQDTKAFDWFDLSKAEYLNWLRYAEPPLRLAIESNEADGAVQNVIISQWTVLLPIGKSDPKFNMSSLQTFLQDARTFMAARDAAINTARQQQQSGLSLEYTYSQPVGQPHISTLRTAFTFHPGLILSDAKSGTEIEWRGRGPGRRRQARGKSRHPRGKWPMTSLSPLTSPPISMTVPTRNQGPARPTVRGSV